MSGRSGLYEVGDDDDPATILWRGPVERALRGRRGAAFLRELRTALDALPTRELIENDLERDGGVCALGCVLRARGVDLTDLTSTDWPRLAAAVGIAERMAREIMYVNDDGYNVRPADRWEHVRRWVDQRLDVAERYPARGRRGEG